MDSLMSQISMLVVFVCVKREDTYEFIYGNKFIFGTAVII